MTTLSSNQHLAALQYPWHTKRGKPEKMLQVSTACSSPHTSRVTSPVEKETLRRQIVGLAVKSNLLSKKTSDISSSATTRITNVSSSIQDIDNIDNNNNYTNLHNIHVEGLKKVKSPRSHSTKRTGLYAQCSYEFNKMPQTDPHESLRNTLIRSKTALNDNKSKPKIVRFRMDEYTIGKQKAPIVHITDNKEVKTVNSSLADLGHPNDYEIRGSAIAMRKEGLKGLLAYKDICAENDKRQNSLQTSLKLFRRRIKLNQEKFIQPNDSTSEDYVIHTRSPMFDVTAPSPVPDDRQATRPLSSDEHVRILRSALHTKHNGGTNAVKQTDTINDTGESYKNIKCSYRLPENPNWGKEVSFKDIKDDVIPNVKTYVLAEETHPHAKFKKNNIQNAVTLNTHNLNVHNSITQVNGQKVKVGENEISFDPRFLDWLEDSFTNLKLNKSSTYMSEDTIEISAPSIKRRIATKT
ncbi:uncharacterized protein LOC132744853 isoform X1 [Ruditapes philippinarum]|uniref:uncharacterized protein LOC132744853 isoform X1 n=2 Tax=Ruditapes philippinarum TaxID=129788 RepID=UPI00295B825F|nr:uncharacterized protein LOC132744853 isoform X1 [Ruditapes philippinarum]